MHFLRSTTPLQVSTQLALKCHPGGAACSLSHQPQRDRPQAAGGGSPSLGSSANKSCNQVCAPCCVLDFTYIAHPGNSHTCLIMLGLHERDKSFMQHAACAGDRLCYHFSMQRQSRSGETVMHSRCAWTHTAHSSRRPRLLWCLAVPWRLSRYTSDPELATNFFESIRFRSKLCHCEPRGCHLCNHNQGRGLVVEKSSLPMAASHLNVEINTMR